MKKMYQGPAVLRKSVHEEEGPLVIALYLLLIVVFTVVGFAL